MSRFGMEDNSAMKNPMVLGIQLSKNTKEQGVEETLFKQLIDSLMYLTITRLDLMYIVSLLSRFMTNPTTTHRMTAKHVLRYIRGTSFLEFGIKRKLEV